jgi:flagellar hook-associated protein FlgK
VALLGEIVKTTQALQYHAKSTEIAGKNLSHVNDESYARQRVVARDGSMYKGVGSLGTSALAMGGLDHARSALLDRRVVSEVGETSSLEAQKEILDLLQAALGERVTRQGVNVGLDDQSESDLAPGSLTRALNDFFNAFQELSASPDEPTIKQELYHKVQTLGKRFNESGEKFESIEADLTATVTRAVEEVNAILEKLHEVNKQVRRFELQDKGKAATYRDRRQQLLEDLSKYMDFKVEDDVDPTSGQASGLLNLFSTTTKGEKVKLLDPNGSKTLTTNWGQEFAVSAPAAAGGTVAQVRAKIGVDGKLGRVEVLDGGSKYSDADGPILVALAPPARTELAENAQAQNNLAAGLAQAGTAVEAALQAGQPVDQGPDLGAQTGTDPIAGGTAADGGVAIGGAQANAIAPATSIPAPFPSEQGEVFNYQGSYFQSLVSTAKGDDLSDETKFLRISAIPNGQVREYSWNLSDLETFAKGQQFYSDGKLYQTTGEISPVVAEDGVANETGLLVSSQGYAKGDVFQHGGTYYQALESLEAGQLLPQGDTVENQSNGFVSLGAQLPVKQLPPSQDDPATSDVDKAQLLPVNPSTDQTIVKGQYLLSNNKYFVALEDFSTGGSEENHFNPISDANVAEVMTFADRTVKSTEKVKTDKAAQQGNVIYDSSSNSHFLVKTSFLLETAAQAQTFDPTSTQWSGYVQKIAPQVVGGNNLEIIRRSYKTTFDPTSAQAVELNLGLAEAIVQKGEIVGFNIINQGSGYPPSDALFVDGVELSLKSGAVHGYQHIRMDEMETFRQQLNRLSTDFVTQVNQLYNPDDEPGGYIFGFDAFLGRHVQGANKVMEEEYGLMGAEGEGEFILYRDEVDMTVPYPEKDTFMVTYAAPVFPEELVGTVPFVRGSNEAEMMLDNPDFVKIYGSARRMKHVTMETDLGFLGADGAPGTEDDGRMMLLGYEKIPFRLEGGEKSFVFGDNFSFDAVPANAWNVAKSMRVDEDFTFDTIKVSVDTSNGANDIALAIAEKGNGEFTEGVSTLNTSIGNSLADVSDNLEHQKAVERLLIDERQAVSSVSMDEEVADLMRFQRSFQASSRVLKTLDSMLELVVMGLLR